MSFDNPINQAMLTGSYYSKLREIMGDNGRVANSTLLGISMAYSIPLPDTVLKLNESELKRNFRQLSSSLVEAYANSLTYCGKPVSKAIIKDVACGMFCTRYQLKCMGINKPRLPHYSFSDGFLNNVKLGEHFNNTATVIGNRYLYRSDVDTDSSVQAHIDTHYDTYPETNEAVSDTMVHCFINTYLNTWSCVTEQETDTCSTCPKLHNTLLAYMLQKGNYVAPIQDPILDNVESFGDLITKARSIKWEF